MEVRRHDLHVDVNGEAIFIVDKQILESFSGRLTRLFSQNRLKPSRPILRVIFDGFPGGPDGFELVSRFCYGNGQLPTTPSSFVLLHCAAQFMEIDTNRSGEYFDEEIGSWSWSDLVLALKQCQNLASISSTSSSFMLNRVMKCIVARISQPVVITSPSTSFSDHSGEVSSDGTSVATNYLSRHWWFEDLRFMNPRSLEKSVRLMVVEKLDHSAMFKFVISHLKFNIRGNLGSNVEADLIEIAVNLFCMLDRSALSTKGLFDVLRVVSGLGMKKKRRELMKVKLETLIGLRLDEASLDQLMIVPSKGEKKNKEGCYKYDVGLVTRLVKAFLIEGWVSPVRLRKVVGLVDSYAREVAPDSLLKPDEFASLVSILPDWGRECSDVLSQAIDIYLEAHDKTCSLEDKVVIWMILNRKKLSAKASKQLAENPSFRKMAGEKVFASRLQAKLYCSENVAYHKAKVTGSSSVLLSYKDRSLPKLCS